MDFVFSIPIGKLFISWNSSTVTLFIRSYARYKISHKNLYISFYLVKKFIFHIQFKKISILKENVHIVTHIFVFHVLRKTYLLKLLCRPDNIAVQTKVQIFQIGGKIVSKIVIFYN